jgi:hypothetical protein
MTIPFEKWITISENKRWWNGMAILILLFGNNSHILIGVQKKIYILYIYIYIYIYFKKIKLKKKTNKIWNKLVGGQPPIGVVGAATSKWPPGVAGHPWWESRVDRPPPM